jgi:2-keto-4-pentenoate hydratase
LVLGDWMPFVAHDWGAQRCRVQIGARPVVERKGTHAMSDPAFVLPAWLRHATRHGAHVAAGTVVTTGTWVGILNADAGEMGSAEFPGIGAASVQL